MPKVAFHLLVEDLVIADGCLEKGVPIDQPLASADEALLKQPEEGYANRPGTLVVEREANAVPVAARSEIPQLP